MGPETPVTMRPMSFRGRGVGRWALAALLGCLALLATIPAIAAAATVTGKVTNAKNEGIAGVEVRYYSSENEYERFVTESNGEYGKDINATAGVFKVEFVPPASSTYASQYYKEKLSYATATPVTVEENKTTSPVSAILAAGASISGTVTDAATSQPLSGITVIAVAPGGSETLEARTSTDANRNYTLAGFGSGSVDVVFQQLTEGKVKPGEVRYIPQFYKEDDFPEHISSFEELFIGAMPVEVTIPNTTSGIDAAMVREEPASKAAPVVSGTPAVGQTLACSKGSWTGLGTLTYAYKWLRDGAAIASASSNTYTVQGADQGSGLACVVTATNEIETEVTRSVSATSNTVTVPLPPIIGPPAPPRPSVTLSSSKLVDSGGTVRVPIACAGANCSGTIELTEQEVTKTHKGKKTIVKKKTVILGKATYSLAAGHSATIGIHLTAKGKSVLAKAKRHQLTAEVIASVVGGVATKKSVVLSERVATKHK